MEILEIKKDDLISNINIVKKHIKSEDTKIIAVIKGNGYGLGLVQYAKFLLEQDINFFAVSTVDEALQLRQAGIEQDILMLSSTCIQEEIKNLVENNIILTLGSEDSVQVAKKIAYEQNITIRAHLKIDTGFGRYGFIYNDVEKIISNIKNLENIKIEGAFSHFSNAYEKSSTWTKIQFNRFLGVIDKLKQNEINPGILHIASSSAFLKYPYMQLDAVRIGSAFVGRIPFENVYGLKKVGVLKSKISEIKILPKDFNVGYLNLYKTKKETKVAIVPIGYKSGFNMQISNDMFRIIDYLRFIYRNIKHIFKKQRITVKINNDTFYVIGKIGMYHIDVDITDKDINIGDNVYLDVNPLHVSNTIRREYI